MSTILSPSRANSTKSAPIAVSGNHTETQLPLLTVENFYDKLYPVGYNKRNDKNHNCRGDRGDINAPATVNA